MEIRTTVKDFPQQIKYHHISDNAYIRVIILEPVEENTKIRSSSLPIITPEEQRHRLNLMPSKYHPEASKEMIKIMTIETILPANQNANIF